MVGGAFNNWDSLSYPPFDVSIIIHLLHASLAWNPLEPFLKAVL